MNDLLERERIRTLFSPERELWNAGFRFVAGVDEAGRGPLAGPVVAAAVMFPQEIHIARVNDSKLLRPAARESLCDAIEKAALSVGIGEASPEEIDHVNILRATFLAMKRAISQLSFQPDYLLIDGNFGLPDMAVPQTPLVKGDRRCFSIAAASILAKVHRDRLMRGYHELFPQYHFDCHKGYPTRMHITAIEKYGYCEIHRRTFKVGGFFGPSEENRRG